MSLAWDMVAAALGMVLWGLIPFFGGAMLDVEGRIKLHNHYARLAYMAAGRVSYLGRKHGGISWLTTKADPEKQAEKISIDGKTGHLEDTHDFAGRVMHHPTFLAHEEGDAVLDARVCELGRGAKQQLEQSTHQRQFESDRQQENRDPSPRFNPYFTIPETDTFVNLRDGLWVLPGSADPFLGTVADEFVKRSQARFKDLNVIEIMTGLIAGLITLGVVWAAYSFGGAGGGIDVAAPIRNLPLGYLWGVWWP